MLLPLSVERVVSDGEEDRARREPTMPSKIVHASIPKGERRHRDFRGARAESRNAPSDAMTVWAVVKCVRGDARARVARVAGDERVQHDFRAL